MMFKTIATALSLALASASPAFADAAPAAAATKAPYSTTETTIAVLLEDPAAVAILDKNVPGLADNPSITMVSGMTLKAMQAIAGDKLTDDVLAAIDADFKAAK